MSTSKMFVMGLVTYAVLTTGAFAEEGTIQKDKSDLLQAKKTIVITREKLEQDKATGNVEARKVDHQVLKEARIAKHQARKRLHQDRLQKLMEEKKS